MSNALSTRARLSAPSPRGGEGWGEGLPNALSLHSPHPALRADLSPTGRGEQSGSQP